MLNTSRLAIALAISSVLAGCARTPSGVATLVLKEMSFEITFSGPINNDYFYFVPLDTSGGGDGPTPVFPGIMIAEAWVTGSATYFVRYHQRQYTVHRIVSLQPFQSDPIGAPIRSTIPDAGSTTLRFTIDLNTIAATGESVDVNIIAVDQPSSDTRLLDGLGPRGTDFLNVDIATDRTITNDDVISPELPGDVLDQNGVTQSPTDQTRPLDITDWSITVDV